MEQGLGEESPPPDPAPAPVRRAPHPRREPGDSLPFSWLD